MFKVVYLSVLFFLLGCGDDQERFEHIDRLRILGLQKTPAILSSNQNQVNLVLWVVTPNRTTDVKAEPFLDLEAKFSLPLSVTNIEVQKTPYAGLDLHAVSATVDLPPVYPLPLGSEGEKRYRVSFRVQQGDQSITSVADIFQFPAESPELKLVESPPTISVSGPTSSQKLVFDNEISLQANVAAPSGEEYKISWFSTIGKIKNPNARQTELTTDFTSEGQAETIIACVRGVRTRSTNCDFVDVEITGS